VGGLPVPRVAVLSVRPLPVDRLYCELRSLGSSCSATRDQQDYFAALWPESGAKGGGGGRGR
jgi:hypothetical protein